MKQALDVCSLERAEEIVARNPASHEAGKPSPCIGREESLRFLSEEEQPLWDELVEASPQGSLFCRSWWLRMAAPQARVMGYFHGGRLVAGIPLFFKKRWGIKLCTMPRLTQTWGVVIEPVEGKREHQISRQMEILTIFARYLAGQRIFLQRFHPEMSNFLPFQWHGFQQVPRVTYVIEYLCDRERIWEGMRDSQRREIRKAEKRHILVEQCEPEVVADNMAKTYARQGLQAPPETRLIREIYNVARQNSAGECFAARDAEGRVHAAALLVWDRKRAYYLAGGGDPTLRVSGATSLLLWKIMQFASGRSAVFDFEGSQLPAVEKFFRAFGASQVWYHEISKMPRWLRAGLVLTRKA